MARSDDVRTAVQADADASGSIRLRVAIGAPGNRLQLRGNTYTSGAAWTAPAVLRSLMAGVAAHLDAVLGISSTFIAAEVLTGTNAGGGVPPSRPWGINVNVPVVGDRNNIANTMRIPFGVTYTTAPAVSVSIVSFGAGPATPAYQVEYVERTTSSVTVAFYDIAAVARRTINDLTLQIVGLGR